MTTPTATVLPATSNREVFRGPYKELPHYPNRKHRGPRKKIGSIDTSSGHIMYFLGYCTDCDGKVLADRTIIDQLKIALRKQQKSLTYKALKALMAHYEK